MRGCVMCCDTMIVMKVVLELGTGGVSDYSTVIQGQFMCSECWTGLILTLELMECSSNHAKSERKYMIPDTA